MIRLSEDEVSATRENVHSINNSLNAISMQAELVGLLAEKGNSAQDIAAAVRSILVECKAAGARALEIGTTVKSAEEI